MKDIFSGSSVTRLRSAITKKRLKIAGVVFLAFLLLTPLITYTVFARDIADRDRLMNRSDTGIVLLDKDGQKFYETGTLNTSDDVPLSQIDDSLEKAVIASEDKNFYNHSGFSLPGIIKAAYANLMNRDATRYGGSTITQQLVKNKLLSSSKNYLRKYQEVTMAVAVEREYSKDEILEMYLNSVYFGEGAFGIKEAAQIYFNKEPSELTLAESSQLIGILPAPSAYSPVSGDAEAAKEQQERVLSKMVENGYITKQEKEETLAVELAYAEGGDSSFDHAQHFALMVIRELEEKYGEERVRRSGFEVKTGLDMEWQKKAESIVKKRVNITARSGGTNASLVAIDPNNGEVRALVGSADWSNKEFGKVNMAISPRQPGSSFKPIYYSKAIEEGLITPATILNDKKTTFGTNYTPKNYDNRYKGEMTVRSALAESRNVPAVQVLRKVGVADAAADARNMGITTVNEPEKYGLSLALGTAETRLVDMTNAYTAFANEGTIHDMTLITEIHDKYGKKIFTAKPEDRSVRSAGTAYLMSSILSDTSARAPTFGSRLNIPGRQVAFKTGTTNDNRDAWTIGFTPQVVVGVWLGNNENEPMRGLAGGSSAGVIWKDTMTAYLQPLPRVKFTKPRTIVQLHICRGTELKAPTNGTNTYLEYFLKEHQPQGTCNAQKEVIEEEPKEEEPKPEEKPVEKKPEEKKPKPVEPPEEEEPVEPTTPPEEEEPTPTPTPTPTPSPTPGSGGRTTQ